MKKKKILFIIWSFTYGGGAERVLATLANAMPKDKYEIDILEYWHANVGDEKLDSNVTLLPPVVNSLKEGKIRRVLKMFLLYHIPSILRKKYIKKEYDVYISFNYMIPTFLLPKNKFTISWIHGDIYDLKNNRYNRNKQMKSLKEVNTIVAISENTYKSIVDVYPCYKDKVVIINNSYNFDKILAMGNLYKVEKKKNKKYLLFMGRYEDNKNPLYLLEVLKRIKDIDYQMIYMGRGELKDILISKISEYGLDDKITVLDYQKNPYPYIKNADIILGSSKSEGFPTTFVEGMIFAKPFISTVVGGVKELSNNSKCGFVCKDIDEYYQKLVLLLTDDKLYQKMSKDCLIYVKKYSCTNQVKELEKLLNNM